MGDPRTSRDLFLDACAGEATERVPLWFMRQAGRVLPEFRALRERHSFEALCRDGRRAAEVTLLPFGRFDVDAAILFSDILVPLFHMDVGLRYADGVGPVLERPLDGPDALDAIEAVTDWGAHPYQAEALARVRKALPEKAVIGFAGAPFTLASYLIEGRSTKRAEGVIAFASQHPEAYARLMDLLVDTLAANLRFQAEAGPDALQLFDTWAGLLPREMYRDLALPFAAQVVSRVHPTGLPIVYYTRNAAETVDLAAETGADVLGVDHTLGLRDARRRVPEGTPLQGNLDPRFLVDGSEGLTQAVRQVLREGEGGPHIFNLGEGMPPAASPERVERAIREVRAFRR